LEIDAVYDVLTKKLVLSFISNNQERLNVTLNIE